MGLRYPRCRFDSCREHMKKLLFIQGIHNKENFTKSFREYLTSKNYKVIHFPEFYFVHQTDKQKELINKIENYLDTLPDNEKIVIVGHSFGGVLSYSLGEKYYNKISKIITVGSPHTVKFKWFKKIQEKLNYKNNIIEINPEIQNFSFGFYFDKTVPFIFTKYKNSKHINFFNNHNSFIKNKKITDKVLRESEEE